MTDATPTEITGTTPAGKALRHITVACHDDDITVTLLSGQRNFSGNIRLDPVGARQLASAINNAATVATLRQQGGKG